MTDQELIELNVDELTEEQARLIGIELLEEDIGSDKARVKRTGIISAVLSAGMFIAGMDNVLAYGIMGVDSMFLMSFFNRLQILIKNRRMVKKFESGSYQDSYVDFVRSCQEYVSKRTKYYNSEDNFDRRK